MASTGSSSRIKAYSRRGAIAGGLTLAGLGSLAGFAYNAAPSFWQRFRDDLGREIEPAPASPNPANWPDTGLHAAWLGHATVLLRLDGFTILTDPVLFDRVGIDFYVATLGIKRLIAPALEAPDLPPVDLVLLSHAHFDHLDLPTLRALESRRTTVITAPGTIDLLNPSRWRSATELKWGQVARAGPATMRGVEVNHWGARVRSDTWRGYSGYVIETDRYRVLFGGDTAWTESFREVKSSRRLDLAIMPIGAYNPWIHYHCTPEQSWAMAAHAGAEFFLPVHHQTFELSREPRREPLERLAEAAGSARDRVVLQDIGDEFHLS